MDYKIIKDQLQAIIKETDIQVKNTSDLGNQLVLKSRIKILQHILNNEKRAASFGGMETLINNAQTATNRLFDCDQEVSDFQDKIAQNAS